MHWTTAAETQILIKISEDYIKLWGRENYLEVVKQVLGEDTASDYDAASAPLRIFEVPSAEQARVSLDDATPETLLSDLDMGPRANEIRSYLKHEKYTRIRTALHLVQDEEAYLPRDPELSFTDKLKMIFKNLEATITPLYMIDFSKDEVLDQRIHSCMARASIDNLYQLTKIDELDLKTVLQGLPVPADGVEAVKSTFKELGYSLKPMPKKTLRHQPDQSFRPGM